MLPQTGDMPLVCELKTMYKPIPTQPAMSTENTHSTTLLRAVSAYSLHLVESWFDGITGADGRTCLVVRNPWAIVNTKTR